MPHQGLFGSRVISDEGGQWHQSYVAGPSIRAIPVNPGFRVVNSVLYDGMRLPDPIALGYSGPNKISNRFIACVCTCYL